MKKYNVTLYYHTTANVEVFASSREEAIEKAYDVDSTNQLLNNLDVQADPDVEEIGNTIDERITKVIEEQATEIANLLDELGDAEFDLYNHVAVIVDGKQYEIGGISYHKAYESQTKWHPSILLWVDENTFFVATQVSSDLTPILDEVKETCRRIEEENE